MSEYTKHSDLEEFDHKYACWANNHNGWSKAKKSERKIAKKKIKRILDKEIEELAQSICNECYECHYYWQNNDTKIQCDGSKCCCEFYRR